MKESHLFNRELSWLSFNYRVLQEAKDGNVPLYERIKFLAIYSSNLDEFFRVRVSSIRSLLRLKKKTQDKLKFDPSDLLHKIHNIVNKQQIEFGDIFRNKILPELSRNGINLITESELSDSQKEFVSEYFNDNIIHQIQPILLVKNKVKPFLKNRVLYLAVKLSNKKVNESKVRGRSKYALVEIPTSHLPRFICLPESNRNHHIIFIDDIIRFSLPKVFEGYNNIETYSIKLNRDADLHIEDEFSGNLVQKIKKGIKKRDTGIPSRFLYDESMPKNFLKFIKESLDLEEEDLVPGARYHNFNDFFSFPNPFAPNFENDNLSALPIKIIDESDNIFSTISTKDIGIHFPYQSYNYVVKFIETASKDPDVESIKITQYRVAENSAIVNALIRAAEAGKDVMAFVEVKARFDEELNLKWAEQMADAGVKVHYSFPGLKVHAKIAIINRKENGSIKNYCYLGTGNFNEKTSKIYSDFGLLTSDKRICNEVENVFRFLAYKERDFEFNNLLVAQFNMRSTLINLIENEIDSAEKGSKAKIILKLNSLEDTKMIKRLYRASNAGVEIEIIVRGICCLVPGVEGLSENIKVISIIDRFLEHARFYYFYNNGEEKIYAASADWMKRNLSRRIEVGFPVYDADVQEGIKKLFEIQLSDNTKARIIDELQANDYRIINNDVAVRSQIDLYNYFKENF